jgi:excisionase family DNA binding protein
MLPLQDIEAATGRLCHSLNDTARMLSIGRRTLDRLVASGKIKTIRVCGHPKITTAELQRFLAACEVA